MAKSRRKAGGCTKGRFRLKKLGKGWARMRRPRGRPAPIVRDQKDSKTDS